MWRGAAPYVIPNHENEKNPTALRNQLHPHLRSTRNVAGYHIEATDGMVGHVADFIIDDETWEIRYLVIDTKNWWPGKQVLVSPRWIDRVSWSESKVFVSLSRGPSRTRRNTPRTLF